MLKDAENVSSSSKMKRVEVKRFCDSLLNMLSREVGGDVSLELGVEKGLSLLATTPVSNGVVDVDLVHDGAILEGDGEGVSDEALLGVVVLGREGLVLLAGDLGAELVDARVGGNLVRVVLGGEASEDDYRERESDTWSAAAQGSIHSADRRLTRNGDHVLDGVVTVGKVGKRSLLVNDTDGGLLGADLDMSNVVRGLAGLLELLVEDHRCLSGGLGVYVANQSVNLRATTKQRPRLGLTELGGERDLEENVLHDVRSVGALELELLSLEEDIVESPGLGGKDGGDAHLAALDGDGEVDGALASISSRPRLARSGVGGVTEGTEGLSVDEDLRDDIDGLRVGEAEEFGDDGSRGELDEDDVVKSDAVERVLESHASLDLVSHDHAVEDVLDGEGGLAVGDVGAGDPVRNSEDSSKVIGGVSPLGSEEAWFETADQ